MKKILWVLVIAAGLGVIAWVLFSSRDTWYRFMPAGPAEKAPQRVGEEPVKPAAPAREPAAPEELQPKPAPPPMRILFEASGAPVLNQPVPVTLQVESNLEGWPAQLMGRECQMELLLRLPVGVKLESGGWEEKPVPPEEGEDGSGPWWLFERKQPLTLPDGVPPAQLARETVSLAVVEHGVNWVITARAKLACGSEAWQTFGVLFATLEGEKAAFHTRPFTPMEVPIPQESPSEGERAETN